MMAIGELGAWPSTLKPFGSSVTRSPWLIQTGYFSPFFQTPSNSGLSADDFHFGAAEFAVMAALDLAAELRRHRLLAVADAEHRHAGVVDRFGRERRVLVEHRGRPARQDHRLRLHGEEGFFRLLERHDLAIDLLLPHPARDELGDLGAEIDDEDFVVQNFVGHGRHLAPELRVELGSQGRSGWLFASNPRPGQARRWTAGNPMLAPNMLRKCA